MTHWTNTFEGMEVGESIGRAQGDANLDRPMTRLAPEQPWLIRRAQNPIIRGLFSDAKTGENPTQQIIRAKSTGNLAE